MLPAIEIVQLQDKPGHLFLQLVVFCTDGFSNLVDPSSQAVACSRLLEAYYVAPAARHTKPRPRRRFGFHCSIDSLRGYGQQSTTVCSIYSWVEVQLDRTGHCHIEAQMQTTRKSVDPSRPTDELAQAQAWAPPGISLGLAHIRQEFLKSCNHFICLHDFRNQSPNLNSPP